MKPNLYRLQRNKLIGDLKMKSIKLSIACKPSWFYSNGVYRKANTRSNIRLYIDKQDNTQWIAFNSAFNQYQSFATFNKALDWADTTLTQSVS